MTSSLAELVHSRIHEKLTSGALRPGQVLIEQQFCEEFSVSRTPVREAFSRLVGENLIEATARGYCVKVPSLIDLAEVYHARALLEGAAAGAATKRLTPSLLADLEDTLGAAKVAIDQGQQDEVARLNGKFHGAIVKSANNRRLAELVASLKPLVVRYRRMSLAFPDHVARSYDEHLRIVALIETGDAAAVEMAVRRHILEAGLRIVTAASRIDGGSKEDLAECVSLLDPGHACAGRKVATPDRASARTVRRAHADGRARR